MANRAKAVAENVAGDFYVDVTCIDCGTCRHVAPETFEEAAEYSFVYRQPLTEADKRKALLALLACPVGCIGTDDKHPELATIRQDFPVLIADNVFYCGFTSPKSYGASSYFIEHPDGNWLVDSPKYLPQLVKHFEAKGGVAYLFLTHSDDVAEAAKYAEHFGAKRIFHRLELWAQPEAEIVVDGEDAFAVTPDFTVIPTPGHTKGHCALLYRNLFLFSGDHLWWNIKEKTLGTPTRLVWSKRSLAASVQKLAGYPFEWLLPGHGAPVHLEAVQMRLAIEALYQKMSQELSA